MRTIIDADSISYELSWGFKKQQLDQSIESYEKVLKQIDQFVTDILIGSKATEYMGFLGGVHPTFRHLSSPDYKSSRGLTKPAWYNQWAAVINSRLKNHWGFHYVEGIEAEDAVSMIAYYNNYKDTVIAHIDKDLNQIPGYHYNYNTQVATLIATDAATKNLFMQVLTGDATDDVAGISKIGPKKASKILELGTDAVSYMMLALNFYINTFKEREGILKFTESYSLVKLLDTPAAGFDPASYSFITYPAQENLTFTDLTTSENEGRQYII